MAAAAIAVAGGAGDAVADVIAVDGRRAVRAGAIFPLRNTRLRKAGNFAVTTIAAGSSAADTTIAARRGHVAPVLRPQVPAKRRFFFPENRWRNIATGR